MNVSNQDIRISQLSALLEGEDDVITLLANASAFIYHAFDNLNWVGFYLLKDNHLQLGPFQGRVACTKIPLGKGVCGTAFTQATTLNIENVHQFEGHIACDSASLSELVIPLHVHHQCMGVLDIDAPILARFSITDQILFEQLTRIIEINLTPIMEVL